MSDDGQMNVIKRNGTKEPVQFDKVLERIRKAAKGLSVNYTRLAQLVLAEIADGIHTTELDELASRIAISYSTTHPDWGILAAQIIVSNCQKSTPGTFTDAMRILYTIKDATGTCSPALSDDVMNFIETNAYALNRMIRHENDYLLDYFGFKTLERAYLMRTRLKDSRPIVETPQYMWLRVSVGIHYQRSTYPHYTNDDSEILTKIKETYDLMSSKAFTHATPTLFNSGTPRPQMSSCFLLTMKEDSIDGIFETLKECAQISKYAGGIGLSIHNIRAEGSFIAGTNGQSDGIMPMLRVFNNTARYVNQGGRRNGSFAIYLEPWHADIHAFIKMKSNTGNEEERARDLFYALWICDLFMKRVEAGQDWSLFCPHEAPGLSDVYGPEFDALYLKYEAEGRARKTVSAQKLWSDILVSQIETGTPYLLYKDAANMKSNQKNLGTIKSSNLCVAPDTELSVYNEDTGKWKSFTIKELENKRVIIWNGTGPSKVVVKKTSEHQPLLRVSIEMEYMDTVFVSHLDCTFYHKFILGSGPLATAPRVEAQALKNGTELYTWRNKDGAWIKQRVVDVRPVGFDETFCFDEPINHAGVFNGILTGNCSEIIEYSSPEETAVCNLASIALPYFVSDNTFNFKELRRVVAVLVRNLNKVIDINFYPTPETKRSNMLHRPIGIGIQGLADIFAMLKIPWETPQASALNKEIFEHIYYAALEESNLLAIREGPYKTFAGSPASQGILQPDLWSIEPSSTLDWTGLRQRIQKTGLRNSLLVAPMPTASTSQILGYNECIEPFTTNIYARRTLAGEFTVVNKYLVKDLMELGLWTPELKDQIIGANGSVQGLDIPQNLKDLYKTVWEIKQKTLIDMAADRGAFICQSQSLNLFVSEPTIAKLSSMHFYAWKKGLKTGLYYLRTKSAVQAIKFSLGAKVSEECLLCSS